jgi:SAM-dependent methyltransferase
VYTYDEDFYNYIGSGAVKSAEIVISTLVDILPVSPTSVLDVGCGAGAWLSVWNRNDTDICGIDGAYVSTSSLLIDKSRFQQVDLREGFKLSKSYDLAQCLEVAEHLPESVADLLVENLCTHSNVVLFSAAPPGQGGENHINEKPYSYWKKKFEDNGYGMYDCIRPELVDNQDVMPWYRYNVFLYLKLDAEIELSPTLKASLIDKGRDPEDISPFLYQLRKRAINKLSVKSQTKLAIYKKKLNNYFST